MSSLGETGLRVRIRTAIDEDGKRRRATTIALAEPRAVELLAAEWKALEQPVAAVPTIAIVAQPVPLEAAASAPNVVVRVVGERVVPEGLMRVLRMAGTWSRRRGTGR